MNQTEKDEWIAALRSGEFRQGQSWLDADGRQCCLGVKCILDVRANRHGIVQENSPHPLHPPNTIAYGYRDKFSIVHSTSSLPLEYIYHKWGLTEDQMHKLAELNDGDDSSPALTFVEIAQWIDDNIPVE